MDRGEKIATASAKIVSAPRFTRLFLSLFATLATVSGDVTYSKAEIEAAWKLVLFQQFHDILPGSSITQVYTDALPQWHQVEQVGTKILQESLLAIASHITLLDPPKPNRLPKSSIYSVVRTATANIIIESVRFLSVQDKK